MFSKYSEKVPPNYGGSRFKRTEAYETETKSHKPSDFSAVKSSVSPSFEQAKPTVRDEALDYAEEFDITNEENEPYIESSETSLAYEEANESAEKHLLSELFSKISTEDLLLICLILFLSADKSLKNNDMIILLSLLLCV